MFEHHKQPLISRSIFLRRVARSVGFGFLVTVISLGAGILGYHFFEGIPWIEALEEASMILSGMGPRANMHTTSGKVFASAYALYSGLILIVTVGVMFAPIAHRFFHKFHLAEDKDTEGTKKTRRR